jgi:hypothetical protein
MKFIYISLLSTLFLASQAEVTWYDGPRNVTCKSHSDGHISCEPGHKYEAADVSVHLKYAWLKRQAEHFRSWKITARSASNTGRGPLAIRGTNALLSGLEKRLTCNLDGVSGGLACTTHCFALNYCNSHCDAKNICHCDCKDLSNSIVPCQKTTCASQSASLLSGLGNGQENSQQSEQDNGQDTEQDNGQDTEQNDGQETQQDDGQDTEQNNDQETQEDNSQDTEQDSDQDTAQNTDQDTGESTEQDDGQNNEYDGEYNGEDDSAYDSGYDGGYDSGYDGGYDGE